MCGFFKSQVIEDCSCTCTTNLHVYVYIYLLSADPLLYILADRTNGRAYAAVLRPSVVCRSVVCNVCIVAKRCETNRKWPMGNRTVTWPMTSRDTKRSKSGPQYA